MMISGPPKEGVELAFEPIREGWSVYKTKPAGAVIRLKLVLLKILLLDVDDVGAKFATGVNIIVTATVPQNQKGIKADKQPTQEEIQKSIVEPDIEYDTVKEEWNEYDVEGIKVGAKLVATVISRTSLFDTNGDPIYNVQYQTVFKPATPEDKEKWLKIKNERLPVKQ